MRGEMRWGRDGNEEIMMRVWFVRGRREGGEMHLDEMFEVLDEHEADDTFVLAQERLSQVADHLGAPKKAGKGKASLLEKNPDDVSFLLLLEFGDVVGGA